MIEQRLTRHQVARGSLPDAEIGSRIYLLKKVSIMHATYQVRLLAYRALAMNGQLVIRVPTGCKVGESLSTFRREHPGLVVIERA